MQRAPRTELVLLPASVDMARLLFPDRRDGGALIGDLFAKGTQSALRGEWRASVRRTSAMPSRERAYLTTFGQRERRRVSSHAMVVIRRIGTRTRIETRLQTFSRGAGARAAVNA